MAVYFVVLHESSDHQSIAYVGKKPTGTSQILGRTHHARYVEVEAASVKDAQEAVARTYGIVNTPIVVTEAQWKES